MSTGTIIGLLLVGFAAGMLSSMVGIGGGVVIVPCLVLVFGLSQKMAQGTSLAMLSLPVAAFSAYSYYKAGNVDWKIALLLASTFIIGGYLGGKWVQNMNTITVKRIFAVFMIVIAIKYLFFDKPKVPAGGKVNTEHPTGE